MIKDKSLFSKKDLIDKISIPKSRYYSWLERSGIANRHNGKIPKKNWLLAEERAAIINYCKPIPGEGYRRLTYKMLDENIVAVSPSSVYRVLKEAGLLRRWNRSKLQKSKGFTQPLKVHDHWHIDISYVNILGTIYFLISILDGKSRYIIHHELRANMMEYDVEITIEKAKEKYPYASPRIISDNGGQFISKDFKEFIRLSGFSHIRTSVAHPQSNGKLERYHRTIKSEEIRKRSYLSIDDARLRIAAYVEYYNKERLNSAIYYLTPEDVLKERVKARLAEREEKLEKARKKRIDLYKEKAA